MESEQIKPSKMKIFGILGESFKIIKTTRKLLLPVLVLVLVFLSFSQLDLAEINLLEPAVNDFSLQLAKNPKLFEDMHRPEYTRGINDLQEVLLVKLFILTLSSITFLFFLVATVSSSSAAYTTKILDREEHLFKIIKSWKKPISTSFYMILIIMALFLVHSFSIGFVVDSWAYLFYGVLCLSVLVLWLYICALWIMSLVVSVLEDIGGLGAIGRARELMKGKKVQAYKMMVLFALTYGIVEYLNSALLSNDPNKLLQLAVSNLFDNWILCALRLLAFVAF